MEKITVKFACRMLERINISIVVQTRVEENLFRKNVIWNKLSENHA